MMESKYIRADLLMNKIAGSAFFSTAEKGKIRAVIEKEPGEDVKPVAHAHWNEDEYGFYSCSNCGYEWDEAEYKTKYCPECGAQMDEQENGAEDES